MDTTWIQVFVLSLSECVAPAGKTVCQEQQLEMLFLNEADCTLALEQLVEAKSHAENVIVNRDRSYCAPTAQQTEGFANLDAINAAFADTQNWRAPQATVAHLDYTQSSHRERLENLKSCDETNGVTPCKVGEIVMEGATEVSPVEVWRRDR